MNNVLRIALLLGFFATATALVAQQSDPELLIPGSDLVAWSYMQNPQPVPPATPAPNTAPEPRPETPAPREQAPTAGQPDQAGQQPAAEPSAQGQPSEPAAQTFTGTVSKSGTNYVLKVSDTTTYQLDDQDKAKQFEGQHVRVTGALDPGSNLIHVQQIEPLT
jgi:hypothetical protein